MKRDMDLIRLVLMELEDGKAPEEMSKFSEEQVTYHRYLAKEAGLIEAAVAKDGQGRVADVHPISLTWDGHEFLDLARSSSVWSKAKNKLLEIGGSWSVDLLKEALTTAAKGMLQN